MSAPRSQLVKIVVVFGEVEQLFHSTAMLTTVVYLIAGMILLAHYSTPISPGGNGSGDVVLLQGRMQSSQVDIHPSRLKLLKEALGWMFFQKEGDVMTESDRESLFLPTILDRYQKSKFYRTFVIAFQQGVLPRLTLKFRDTCDPDYSLKLKDPYSSTVTWHYLKKFTFEIYEHRASQSHKDLQFCDYRQGLMCHPTVHRCSCRDGADMENYATTSALSTNQRCVVKRHHACNLIDLAHGSDPKHKALAKELPWMMFNLLKPISCQSGSTCRFKSDNLAEPSCYPISQGPFHPPPSGTWTLELGAECTLGLIATPGSCELNTGQYGNLPGLVCYNLGHIPGQISLTSHNTTGFCLPEFGPYGLAKLYPPLTNNQYHFHPMFLSFTHPRNVRLVEADRISYYKTLMKIHGSLLTKNILQETKGAICSSFNTERMKEVWTSYARLEFNRPPGGYTYPESLKDPLDKNLQKAFSLISLSKPKVCKVYHHFYRTEPGLPPREFPALKCVLNGAPDPNHENDGICQESEMDTKATLPFSIKLQAFLDHISLIHVEHMLEEIDYQQSILAINPERECVPGRSSCIAGFECVKDYADYHGIYEPSNCSFTSTNNTLDYACKEMADGTEFQKCEGQYLDKMIRNEVALMLGNSSKLGFGQACRLDWEKKVRDWMRNGGEPIINKYVLWSALQEQRRRGYGGGFCDVGRLLECASNGKCGCVDRTRRRAVNVDGIDYKSDYCYLLSGSCRGGDVSHFVAALQEEKTEMWKHYGHPKGGGALCKKEGGNLCFFLDEKRERCSDGTRSSGEDGDAEDALSKVGADHASGTWVVTLVVLLHSLIL